MKLQPLGDRIIVKRNEKETTTASGIIIPDSSKEKPIMGKVLAVGSGEVVDGKRIPLDIVEGDTIIFQKYAGSEVEFEGEKYLILKQNEVLAIVK